MRGKHLALDDEGDVGAVRAVQQEAEVGADVGRRRDEGVVVAAAPGDDDPARDRRPPVSQVQRLDVFPLHELPERQRPDPLRRRRWR